MQLLWDGFECEEAFEPVLDMGTCLGIWGWGEHETEKRLGAEASRQEVVGCVSREAPFAGNTGDTKQQNGGESGGKTDRGQVSKALGCPVFNKF